MNAVYRQAKQVMRRLCRLHQRQDGRRLSRPYLGQALYVKRCLFKLYTGRVNRLGGVCRMTVTSEDVCVGNISGQEASL
jgi:hypothetical protein